MAAQDPWDRMCAVADHNALNIACGTWEAGVEADLVASMVLAGRESLGASGLLAVHSLRAKIIGDAEWRGVHTSATAYYAGAVRSVEASLDAVLLDIYGASSEQSPTLATRAIALIEQVGGYESEQLRRLRRVLHAFTARGANGAGRMIAWRMLSLDDAPGSERSSLLLWLRRTATTEADFQSVVTELERAALRALEHPDGRELIEVVFEQHRVFGAPFRPGLQELVDARLTTVFADDEVAIAAERLCDGATGER